MDYSRQLIFITILLVSTSVYAALPPASIPYSYSNAGTSVVYSMEAANASSYFKTVPSAGITNVPINASMSSNGAEFQRMAKIPFGTSAANVVVKNPIPKSSMASSVFKSIFKSSLPGFAIFAGMAIYDYLNDMGVTPNNDGTASVDVPGGSDMNFNASGEFYNTLKSEPDPIPACQNKPAYCWKRAHPADPGQLWQVFFWPISASSLSNMCLTVGFTFNQSSFNCQGGASIAPLTEAELLQRIAAAPYPPGDVVKELVNDFNEPPAYDPSQLTGPASVASSPQVEVSPDGHIVTTTPTYDLAYDGLNVTAQRRDAIHIQNPDGTTRDIDTTPTTELPTQETDCEKFPKSIGCAEFGEIDEPDELEENEVSMPMSPSSWGAGSCPAPIVLSLSHGSKLFSLQPMCDFMTGVYPVVIAISWLMAGFIVMSALRD